MKVIGSSSCYEGHRVKVILWRSSGQVHIMKVIGSSSCYEGHRVKFILWRSSGQVHIMKVIGSSSCYEGHRVKVMLWRSSGQGHVMKVIGSSSYYEGHRVKVRTWNVILPPPRKWQHDHNCRDNELIDIITVITVRCWATSHREIPCVTSVLDYTNTESPKARYSSAELNRWSALN